MSNDTPFVTDPLFSENATASSATHDVQKVALAGLLSIVIVVVIVGNTLVILAVATTRRLRTVTNCFVMSLAIADWLVGVFVMPPAVAYSLKGVWELGWILCDLWVSLDILLCTASILSLCAISVDRYLAVTQPLSYSRKRRSKRLAFLMILVVWVSSALITCPPMFGWYEPGRHKDKTCRYNKNTGYVIFSAMGSFFIPMVVMLYVYVRISCVIAQRHDQLGHLDTHIRKTQKLVADSREESSDCEDANGAKCTRCPRPAGGCPPPVKEQTSFGGKRKVPGRSLRLNCSLAPHQEAPRSASLYRTPLASRPESLNLDPSMLNFEPANRVSSFRRETKTAQTLSIVMGGFIACWLPFFIFYLLTPFIPSNDVNSLIMSYFTWLGWINSAINPFIYAFYSPDFRIAFWRLTIKHFSKSHRADIAFQPK